MTRLTIDDLIAITGCTRERVLLDMYVFPTPCHDGMTKAQALRCFFEGDYCQYRRSGISIDAFWDEIGIPRGWPHTSASQLAEAPVQPRKPPRESIPTSATAVEYRAKHGFAPTPAHESRKEAIA